jgi:hypothetical protein
MDDYSITYNLYRQERHMPEFLEAYVRVPSGARWMEKHIGEDWKVV